MTAYDYLIVGAGLFGATCARALADAGKRVLVLERAAHVGGMAHDELRDGIRVSLHGGHIFHTNDRRLWEYVNRFAEFEHYSHHVKALAGGMVYSLPINLATFQVVSGATSRAEAEAYLAVVREAVVDVDTVEGWCLAHIGRELYELLIEGYTRKQWGRSPAELPAAIIRRLPVRLDWNDHYFGDAYQGLPVGGYTSLVENMLRHPGITLGLGEDFLDQLDLWQTRGCRTIYTGPLDALLGYELGKLEYRSMRFEHQRLAVPDYQGAATMNYCDAGVPWLRIEEWRHWWRTPPGEATWITRTYPAATGEPLYPVNTPANQAQHAAYVALAAERYPQLVAGGRMGSYQYLDMHQAIAAALQLVERELS